MSVTARRPGRPSLPTLAITSFLSALMLFAVTSVSQPADALGAIAPRVSICTANLRTSSSLTARLRVTIPAGTRVTVVAGVTGGRWRTTCAGKSATGTQWYRISAVNGRSVKSLYGVSYLYAASSLFKIYYAPTYTRYAACNAYLRTSAATSAPSKALIQTNAKVLATAGVVGSTWSTTCAGKAVSGTWWYRIVQVNGKTVQSLYGVPYVYAAQGLFSTTVTVAATPTPTPTIAPEALPTATPTPAPTATPSPTPTPTSTASPAPTAAPTPTPTAAPTATPSPTPTPPAFLNMTEGIDISHWQGTIDWTKVASAGKRFAFMKASESTDYVDPTYTTNRSRARTAGLYVGAYHFAQPNAAVGNGIAQADWFLANATPARGDLLPVLDLERSNTLSQAALTTWVKDFVGRIYERLGVRAVIYVSPSFWRTYMGDTTWFALNGYEVLWIAHWTAATTPSLPAASWGSKGWTFWQYTSDGVVPGISGRVDLNRYNGTNFTKVLIP